MVASVPELTILTFSIDGTISTIFLASNVSSSVDAPYVVPFLLVSVIDLSIDSCA